MKVIVAGSRNWGDYMLLAETMSELLQEHEITEVVSGGARGADFLGEQWARSNGIKVSIMEADWDQYGRYAGPERNRRMAKYADALVLFWDGKSKGSASMKREAESQGIPILKEVVQHDLGG